MRSYVRARQLTSLPRFPSSRYCCVPYQTYSPRVLYVVRPVNVGNTITAGIREASASIWPPPPQTTITDLGSRSCKTWVREFIPSPALLIEWLPVDNRCPSPRFSYLHFSHVHAPLFLQQHRRFSFGIWLWCVPSSVVILGICTQTSPYIGLQPSTSHTTRVFPLLQVALSNIYDTYSLIL